jgi:hypothetical protein
VSIGGAGYHVARVAQTDPGQIVTYAKISFFMNITYLHAVLFSKLAILSIYQHVFTDPVYRKACWCLAWILTANDIAALVATCFCCTPLHYFWDRLGTGTCIDILLFTRLESVTNIVSDVAMLLLPLPTIWKLQISRSLKIGLLCTFAMGSM